MRKDNKEKKQCSLDEEMLMWTSYRYCIGRHTYVSTLAQYIGQKYYGILSDEKLEFTAQDIRNCIYDVVSMGSGGVEFHYDHTIPEKDRNALSDLIEYINGNVQTEDDIAYVKQIRCYKESYRDDEPKKFSLTKELNGVRQQFFRIDIADLLEWHTLASLFDKKNHEMVTVRHTENGEVIEKQMECFKTWKKKYEETEGKPGYYTEVNMKWEECYIDVEHYIKGGHGTLIPEIIVKTEPKKN